MHKLSKAVLNVDTKVEQKELIAALLITSENVVWKSLAKL
jgi:hypothetical protein